jgi:hypothetical protein
MLVWRSNSLAVLVLAAGALSPCAILPSARAGDKIEFSAPGASLGVPQVVRDDKEPSKTGMPASMQADDGVQEEEQMEDSSEVVVLSTANEKGVKTWDSAFTNVWDTNVWDNDIDANSRYDDLDSRQRPIHGATNGWDMPGELNPDAGTIFSEKRKEEAAIQDILRDRSEAVMTAGRTDYQKDEYYGGHFPNPNKDSASFRNFLDHGSSGLERIREGQYMPFYEEMKAINEQFSQGYSPARLFSAANGLPHDSTLPSGVDGYTWQKDVARGNTPGETASAPRTIHPAETRTVSQNPDRFGPQEPPASPPGQVQSRPAILPFPKKPGSVFQ